MKCFLTISFFGTRCFGSVLIGWLPKNFFQIFKLNKEFQIVEIVQKDQTLLNSIHKTIFTNDSTTIPKILQKTRKIVSPSKKNRKNSHNFYFSQKTCENIFY